MSEYTPDTDTVLSICTEESIPLVLERDEFDRWLAEVERAAAEKAWDEGRESGGSNAVIQSNPYREGDGSGS